jgi:hypothetical protein
MDEDRVARLMVLAPWFARIGAVVLISGVLAVSGYFAFREYPQMTIAGLALTAAVTYLFYMNRPRKQKVPHGKVIIQGDTVFETGEYYPKDGDLFVDLRPTTAKVTIAVAGEVYEQRDYVITWKPCVLSADTLRTYLDHYDRAAFLQTLQDALTVNPDADLQNYADEFGLTITRVESTAKEEPEEDAIEWAKRRVGRVTKLGEAALMFDREMENYPHLKNNQKRYNQMKAAFDHELAKKFEQPS